MHIVKRKGHAEKFEPKKTHRSIYKACLNASLPRKKATTIANSVTKQLQTWIRNKPYINAHTLFLKIIELIKKKDKNAAFMYETHRDIN